MIYSELDDDSEQQKTPPVSSCQTIRVGES